MGSLKIAWKDIKRNKIRSIMYIFIYSLAVSTSVSLMLFSHAAGDYILRENIHLNGSVIRSFQGYVNFLLNFSIFTVIIESSLLASLLTLSRMKDLAILLSVGGTFKQIQRIPLAEIFLITIIGNIIGILEGILAGNGLIMLLNLTISDFNVLGFTMSLIFLIIISVIGSYSVSSIFVGVLLKKNFREMLESQYQITTSDSARFWKKSLKNKFNFKLGYLFQKRAQIISFIMVFGILMLSTILTMGILGGSIIQETTDSNMQQGYGIKNSQDNVIVVTSSITFSRCLQELYDIQKSLQFDFPEILSTEHIPEEFIRQIPPEITFESRLLLQGSIKMLGAFKIKNNRIVNIGNSTFKSYIWGVDSSFTNIFNYNSYKGEPTTPISNNIIIGDGYQLFYEEKGVDSLIPKEINNYSLNVMRFNVVSAVIDPFAKGFCSYIDISILNELSIHLPTEGKNAVFILNPTDNEYELIQKFNLSYFSLKTNYNSYLSNSQQFWMVSNLAFLPVLVVLGFSFVIFSSLATFLFQKDLYILRVLGGRSFTLKRIILWLNILVGAPGVVTGIFLGVSITYSNLSEQNVQPSIYSWFSLMIIFLIIFIFLERYLTLYIRKKFNSTHFSYL